MTVRLRIGIVGCGNVSLTFHLPADLARCALIQRTSALCGGDLHGTARGSGAWPVHESRIQACVGSSQKFIERSSPGPASTFR